MSQYSTIKVGLLTVAVGQTLSNVIGGRADSNGNYVETSPIDDAIELSLVGPAALAGAASGTVLVARLPGATPSATLEATPGVAWAIPLAGKEGSLPSCVFSGLQLSVNAAVTGADAAWTLYKKVLL